MKLKEKLKRGWYIQQKIIADTDRIERLRAQAEKVTTHLSQMPKGGGPGGGMADVAGMIVDTERGIQKNIQELVKALSEIESIIALLPDGPGKIVMQYRYVNFCKWDEIALKMSYSKSNIYVLHGHALKFLNETLH